ncbi:hypothetical protein BKA66DRAFT_453414 [Pyrenochaeta sp. MPI-SDFR-AT-0127]|nr:hypothetical protein BKA66DRAFT_453414 [Pyrenochaeta sp. MPI-SDFR-AT-0127]
MLKKQQEQFAAVFERMQAEDPALAPKIAQSLVEEGLLQNAVDVYSEIILKDGAKTARLGTLTTLSYLFKQPCDPRLILDTKLFPIVKQQALESESIAEPSRSTLFLLLRAFNTKESFTIAFDMIHKALKRAGCTHLQFPDLASTECRPLPRAAQTRLLRIYLERNDKESLTKAFNILQEERSIIELKRYSAAEEGKIRRDVAESDALNALLEYWFELGTDEALALISGVLEDETNRDRGANIFPQQALVSRFAEQTISRRRLDKLSVVAKAMLQRHKSPFSTTCIRLTVIPLIEAYLDSEDWDHLDDIWEKLKNRPDSDICIAVTERLAKSHASNDRREKLLSTLVAFDRAYRDAEQGWPSNSKRQITLKQICATPGVDAADELMVIQAIEVLDGYHRTVGYKTFVLFILWHYVEHDLLNKIPHWDPSWERFDTPVIIKPIMEKLVQWVKTNPQVCHEIVAAGGTDSLFTHSLSIARWELDPKRSETGPTQSDSITTPFDILYSIQVLAMRLDKPYSIKVVSLAFTTANLLEHIAEDEPVRAQFQLGANAVREKYVQQFLNQQPKHPFADTLMIKSILRQRHHTPVVLRRLHQAALLPDALHSKTLLETGQNIARHIEEHGSSSEIQQLAVELMEHVFQRCRERLPLDTPLTYDVLKDLIRLWRAQQSAELFTIRKLYQSIWEGVPSAWTTQALSCIGLLVSLDAFESGRQQDALGIALRICSHDELTYGWKLQTFDSWNVVSYYYSASNEHEQAYKIHSRILPMAKKHSYSPALDRRVHQQTNLLGRALQRMGRWLEAQKVYQDLWLLCSREPEDWMYRKLGNISSWGEHETAIKALEIEMEAAGPLPQFVRDVGRSDARSDFHQDVCAGGLRGYLAGPVNEKAAFWEFSWQLD